MKNTIHLSDANFSISALNSDFPVLVCFTADYCTSSKSIKLVLNKLAVSYVNSIRVGFIDVDLCPETVKTYKVSITPTMLMFKQGKLIGEIVGLVSENTIKDLILKAL